MQNQLQTYQSNELILAQNLEELNQKLANVHKQCEEIRQHNSQLTQSKEQLEKQLQIERSPTELIHQQNQTESSWSFVSHQNYLSVKSISPLV